MFITELPGDEYGNRAYTNSQAQVIEVEVVDQYSLRVIAPASFCEKWPTLSQWPSLQARNWKEVSGPARLLTQTEYEALISS